MLLPSEEIRKRRQQILKDRAADCISGEQAGQRLIQIDPDYGPGWLALGSAKLDAGDLEAAESLMWSALERAPTSPAYYLSLSSVCERRGDLATSPYLAALAFWKASFLDEVPEDLGARLLRGAEVDAEAGDPGLYEAVAEKFLAELGDQPWPERLRPYRLLNELQRHEEAGLPAELIDEIRANASACAPLFRAALRESYDTKSSSLTMEAECLVVALLGEIGGPGLIEELITLPDTSAEEGLHAHWAVMRVGQRFPAEARALWLNLPKSDTRLGTAAAQHLYFLRDAGVSRKDVEALLDGFREFAADEEAPYLLLTVSTVLALMGSNADALAVMKRHERQLSKGGRRWILDATGDEDGFLPDLIAIGLDELDIGVVCGELGLLPPEDQDDPDYEDEYQEEEPPAPKPGRNDPCWCGSGKKYKKCHLEQDEREAREGRAEDDLFRNALGQLLDFSKRFHGKSDADRASKLLLGRRLSEVDEEAITESGFILWYLLDFRALSGARTVVEEFLRQSGDRLDDRTRELIESWRDNRYGLWEIQRIEVGRGAEVRDLVSGETYFVDDINTSRECHRWDCMINRVHRFDGKWQFLGDGLLVPRPLLPTIREEVEEGARASGLAPAAYFRSRSHEWRRILLEAHDEQWKGLRVVNFEGDPIELSSAEYEVGDADAVASVLAGLPIFEERTDEDDEPGRRVFDWAGETGKDGGRRLYGHIEIGDGKLRLECNSRRRLQIGRELIEKYCGAYARHVRDAVADPPSKSSKPIDPALEREVISKVYAEHYAKWPDERLPALGGRTPREAVRSKRGREQVEQLLRDFENGSERDRKEGRPAFDFSKLRSELGL